MRCVTLSRGLQSTTGVAPPFERLVPFGVWQDKVLPDGSPPPIPEKIYQMAFRMRQVGWLALSHAFCELR